METPERRQWRRSGVYIVIFERISHTVLLFSWLTWTSKCRLGTLITMLQISNFMEWQEIKIVIFWKLLFSEIMIGQQR